MNCGCYAYLPLNFCKLEGCFFLFLFECNIECNSHTTNTLIQRGRGTFPWCALQVLNDWQKCDISFTVWSVGIAILQHKISLQNVTI